MTRYSFAVLATLALASSTAYACPTAYDAYSCDSGGEHICHDEIATSWVCDLTTNGDTTAATITVVAGYTSGYDYSAWGTDATGASFCCELVDATDVETVSAEGGTYNDTISFTYTSGGTTWNLNNKGDASRLVGFGSGGAGDDTITGSKNAGAYLDSLHGDGDNDTVNGNLGADEVTGGDGDDLLYGGGSADIIHGGNGNDTIYGEAGNDNITGDDGDDYVDGGGDSDFITGGLGGDVLAGQGGTDTIGGGDGMDTVCGGGGGDHLCGGADDDQVWGDSGTDYAMGMAGTDACSAETTNTCESTLSSKPSVCP